MQNAQRLAATGIWLRHSGHSRVSESTSGSAFVDVNGDGALDAILSCRYDNKLVVLMNDGFGGLSKPVSVSTLQSYPHDVVATNLMGDTKSYVFVSEAR